MKQRDKLRVVKKHLETIREVITEMNNLSLDLLKDYIKITVQSKSQFYPEIIKKLNESLETLNEVLNENDEYRKKLSKNDFKQ